MKKLIVAAALVLIPMSQAMADQNIGCGLGSMAFEGQTGLAPKVLGATTNGTSGNQTFGITFGTLGCSSDGAITSRETLALFIDGNMDNLARDIAKGQGETLATLSEVWGIKAQDKSAFSAFTQANFAKVFSTGNVTSQQVFDNLNTLLAQEPKLASYSLA